MELTYMTILLGVLIAVARVVDVSIGTIRTISIVHGRVKTAFFLGFVESAIWLVVMAAVINEVRVQPVLGVFYAFGFALGNSVGIMIEKRLAFGHAAVRVISQLLGKEVAEMLRKDGYSATTFPGEGMSGPVMMIYIVIKRREMAAVLKCVRSVDPDAFYIAEQAGLITKSTRPIMPQRTGWRGVLKKK